MYRLDRQAFAIHTFETASHQRAYWLSKTPGERLAAAWNLTCRAWNLNVEEEHRLDRTHFSIRQREKHASKSI